MTARAVYTLVLLSWLHTYLVKGRGYSEADLPLSALPISWARTEPVRRLGQ
jgi:hypothetical protein